ncbi:MAG: asparagine synthetase B [Candidatus Micrarchaeota archaeon]|nr:asparagine synthetase B [Candidatus Micrarchaeota archaeon]
MCGIFGIVRFRGEVPREKIAEMWKRIEHRGRDLFKVWVDGEEISAKTVEKCMERVPESFRVLIAQNTLSITGKPCFPKEKNGKVIASNGEIFNYRDGQYDLNAFFSLPLEKIRGIYASAELDTEKNILRLFRDPIGVNPLCYLFNEHFFAFSSELKSLRPAGKPVHLHPRKMLRLDLERKKIEFEKHPLGLHRPEKFVKAYRNLETLINSAIEMQTRGLKRFGIMLSGGVDSTLLARICQEHERKFVCFSCGTEESEDIRAARKIGEEFGFKVKEIILDEDMVLENLGRIVHAIETKDFVQVSIAIPGFFVSQASFEYGNKVVFSGLGCEELFAGYYKYRKHPERIHETCMFGLENIWINDLYRENCISMINTQELRVPYLDLDVVNYSLKIHPSMKVKDGIEKFVLRKIAEKYIGEYAWRKKKASQYGSGVVKIVERLARRYGYKKKSDIVKLVRDF